MPRVTTRTRAWESRNVRINVESAAALYCIDGQQSRNIRVSIHNVSILVEKVSDNFGSKRVAGAVVKQLRDQPISYVFQLCAIIAKTEVANSHVILTHGLNDMATKRQWRASKCWSQLLQQGHVNFASLSHRNGKFCPMTKINFNVAKAKKTWHWGKDVIEWKHLSIQ